MRSFQGGYLDIPPPPPKFQQCCPTPKPKPDRRVTKLSPAEDLIYYWLKQGGTDCSKANSSRPESAYTAKNAHKPSPRASTSTKKGSEPGEEERCQQRRFLFDISRNALFIAASECMLVLEALQASADARTWDLKKLDLSESAWLGASDDNYAGKFPGRRTPTKAPANGATSVYQTSHGICQVRCGYPDRLPGLSQRFHSRHLHSTSEVRR